MSSAPLLILLGGLSFAEPMDAQEKAKQALQGDWRVVGVEEKGERWTPEDVRKQPMSLKIKGNEITLYQGTMIDLRFTFRVDPTKSPAHLDLDRLDERVRGKTCHAIYVIQKGQLKICLSSNFNPTKPEERPQEFATILGSTGRPPKGKLLFIFERERK
jgi:uncharacterized protein (TIGR03067 family)